VVLKIDEKLCAKCGNCTKLIMAMPDCFYGEGREMINWTVDDYYLIPLILQAKLECRNCAITMSPGNLKE